MIRDQQAQEDGAVEVLEIPTGEEVPQGAIPIESIFNLVLARTEGHKYFIEWISSVPKKQRERFRLVIASAVQYYSIRMGCGYLEEALDATADIISNLVIAQRPGVTTYPRPRREKSEITQAAINLGLIEETEGT